MPDEAMVNAREADCVVLIPYYESAEGLKLAVESVRDPHHRVRILVIDDGSIVTPAVVAIRGIEPMVPVSIIALPSNRGIEHALNYGIEHVVEHCTYIARMDCGDEATSDRFERQLEYLDDNPDLMLLGGAGVFYNQRDRYVHRNPERAEEIRRAFRMNCPFIHPSVIFRAEVVATYGVYPTDRPAAEDYAFFWKIAAESRIENLLTVVVKVHVDPGGISSVRRKQQIRSRMRVMLDWFDWSPMALWGLVRSVLLYGTPRYLTLRANAWRRSRK